MTLEERKDNTYFDKKGRQILVGDLLKVYHYGRGNRTRYMYHVVVMEEASCFQCMAAKAHYSDKSHYRLFQVCDNPDRVYLQAEIIGTKDWQTKRQRL